MENENSKARLVLDSYGRSQGILVSEKSVSYSESINTKNSNNIAVATQADSGGIPEVLIQFEQSPDNKHWEIPENAEDLFLITDTEFKKPKKLNAVPFSYIRFKLTGLETNGASTRVNIWLSEQN